MKKNKDPYPRLTQLGIPIREDNDGPPGINGIQLDLALKQAGLSIETFSKLFGCQTCGSNGMYPHDVESVLERMMSGKLTGTQLNWD
jgi:hypothetical protein